MKMEALTGLLLPTVAKPLVRVEPTSVPEVLNMTVLDAIEFMSSVPPIRQKLETMRDVGLDYIHLGQFATTLSGGR